MVNSRQEVLAIIPARGGSKSIPRKNVKLLAGHPLIAYSIAAGLQADRVTRVVVSTDDEEIAQAARAYGAETPFVRPASLAGDDVLDFPVFDHALRWLGENEGYRPDVVVQLRPTSPIRPRTSVDESIAIITGDPRCDSVRAVTPSGQNPFKMWRIENGSMVPLIKTDFIEQYNMPRQKLPASVWQTGHVDTMRYETVIEKKSLTGDRILPLMIDPRYAFDIDNQEQWEFAEWALSHWDFDPVRPGESAADLSSIRLVVFDFDGVLTDNRVYVAQDGTESVACNRSDGWGIARLKEIGIQIAVLSTEENPVVTARCKKLGIACHQGKANKGMALKELVSGTDVPLKQVAFVGNDVNDLECMQLAGVSVAVADAYPEVKELANLTLKTKGGAGAAREFCDLIISASSRKENKR